MLCGKEAPYECFAKGVAHMFKFILTAERETDLINLLVNTASVDVQRVKWNVNSITRSEEDAHVDNWMDLGDWVKKGEWDKLDDAIMSGEDPEGSSF